MTRIVGGIDGGQSSTEAAIADEGGRILGRATGPPADLVGEPPGSARQRLALEATLAAALGAAGLASGTPLAALVIGLTGHDAGTPAPWAAIAGSEARFVHDTEIAHAGALGGDAGIVVLAGTGSVALGNAAGSGYVRAGGWGYFFGDRGGALWIARRAISTAMDGLDRGDASPLATCALDYLDLPDLRAIQHAFARGDLTRPALAAFARVALEAAGPQSRDLCAAAARELVELVATVEARLPPTERRLVSFAGGVFGSEPLREAFGASLQRRLPDAELVLPRGDPLEGALGLARVVARSAPSQRTPST